MLCALRSFRRPLQLRHQPLHCSTYAQRPHCLRRIGCQRFRDKANYLLLLYLQKAAQVDRQHRRMVAL